MKEIFVKICYNWTPSRTWKCTRWILQKSYLYASDFPFKNFCKVAQHAETIRKNVWDKSNDTYSSIRVQTTINHILICLFFTTLSTSKKMCFFSEREKWHCTTHWREQRGMDSYRRRQISQSDCEISSNCVKIDEFLVPVQFQEYEYVLWLSDFQTKATLLFPSLHLRPLSNFSRVIRKSRGNKTD